MSDNLSKICLTICLKYVQNVYMCCLARYSAQQVTCDGVYCCQHFEGHVTILTACLYLRSQLATLQKFEADVM